MNSMKLVIPSHFTSWKKTPNDAVTPQRQSQFTPKMKANVVPCLLSSLVWIDQCNECNGITSFMEFMIWASFKLLPHRQICKKKVNQIMKCFFCWSNSTHMYNKTAERHQLGHTTCHPGPTRECTYTLLIHLSFGNNLLDYLEAPLRIHLLCGAHKHRGFCT